MASAARSDRITRHVARLLRAERERSVTTQAPAVKAAAPDQPGGEPGPPDAEPHHRLPRIHRPTKVGAWKPARS